MRTSSVNWVVSLTLLSKPSLGENIVNHLKDFSTSANSVITERLVSTRDQNFIA
jgi:hypothetical protein